MKESLLQVDLKRHHFRALNFVCRPPDGETGSDGTPMMPRKQWAFLLPLGVGRMRFRPLERVSTGIYGLGGPAGFKVWGLAGLEFTVAGTCAAIAGVRRPQPPRIFLKLWRMSRRCSVYIEYRANMRKIKAHGTGQGGLKPQTLNLQTFGMCSRVPCVLQDFVWSPRPQTLHSRAH